MKAKDLIECLKVVPPDTDVVLQVERGPYGEEYIVYISDFHVDNCRTVLAPRDDGEYVYNEIHQNGAGVPIIVIGNHGDEIPP